MWDLIVSVPDHCLSFYLRFYVTAFEHNIIIVLQTKMYVSIWSNISHTLDIWVKYIPFYSCLSFFCSGLLISSSNKLSNTVIAYISLLYIENQECLLQRLFWDCNCIDKHFRPAGDVRFCCAAKGDSENR